MKPRTSVSPGVPAAPDTMPFGLVSLLNQAVVTIDALAPGWGPDCPFRRSGGGRHSL